MFHGKGIRAVQGTESCIESIEGQMRLRTLFGGQAMLARLNGLLRE